ncbi:MAG: type II toxin-antitoxin system VapC family toxin [Rubrobacter sp.]
MTAYLDASIVLSYYLTEVHSDRAQEIYQTRSELEISELVELEVLSSLSRLARVGSIELDAAKEVSDLFDSHLREGLYGRRHLGAGHYRRAHDYIARFDLPLKAPAALHLALCAAEELTLLTADRQLARNAGVLNVQTELVGQ